MNDEHDPERRAPSPEPDAVERIGPSEAAAGPEADAHATVIDAPIAEPIAVLAPAQRSRRWLYAALAAIGVVASAGAALGWLALDVVRDEEARWQQADSAGSEEGWRSYVTWADDLRARGGIRDVLATRLTSIDARLPRANDRAWLARAEAAARAEDWAALCAIHRSQAERDAGRHAQAALQERIDRALIGYQQLATQRQTPEHTRTPILAALASMRREPCGAGMQIRFERSIDERGLAVPGEGSTTVAETLGGLDLAAGERALGEAIALELTQATGGALPVRFAEDDDGGASAGAIVVTLTLVPRDRFLTPQGREVPGIALQAQLAVTASGAPAVSEPAPPSAGPQVFEATLPPDFALEFFQTRDGQAPATLSQVYEHAIAMLHPALGPYLRRMLGLVRFENVWRASPLCAGVAPLAFDRVVRNRIERGEDRLIASCVDGQDYDGYGDNYDEPPSRPEHVYRLVVPERADVVIGAVADFDAALYLRRQCSDSDDVACDEVGAQIEATLDPGVYYAVLDSTEDGARGGFTLVATRRDPARVSAACGRAAALTDGEPVTRSTQRGSDALWGSCGGVGAPEQVHTLAVERRSRLRCVLQGALSFTPVMYLRSACADRDSEIACTYPAYSSGQRTPSAITATVEPGRYAVVVDGIGPGERGEYTLRCELAPADGLESTPADTCETVGTLEAPGRAEIDTLTARSDPGASCGSAAPDRVYQFELAQLSQVRITTTGSAPNALAILHTCGDPSSEVACGVGRSVGATLPAGRYFVAADHSDPSSFGAGTIEVQVEDLQAVCDGAPLLAPGTTRSTLADRPSRFRPSCARAAHGGPEDVYRLRVERRSRVQLALRAGSGAAVYVRGACGGEDRACSVSDGTSAPAVLNTELDRGEYLVFVDPAARGSYELEVQLEPAAAP